MKLSYNTPRTILDFCNRMRDRGSLWALSSQNAVLYGGGYLSDTEPTDYSCVVSLTDKGRQSFIMSETFESLERRNSLKTNWFHLQWHTNIHTSKVYVYTLVCFWTHYLSHTHNAIKVHWGIEECSSGFPLFLLHFLSRQRPLLGSSHQALELALHFGPLSVNTPRIQPVSVLLWQTNSLWDKIKKVYFHDKCYLRLSWDFFRGM